MVSAASQVEYLPLADIKYKEAQCLIADGELGAAISALESIMQFARTAEVSATLGRVYESSGLKRQVSMKNHPMAQMYAVLLRCRDERNTTIRRHPQAPRSQVKKKI